MILVGHDRVGLVVDDRLHKVVLVGEVVVELRAADLGRGPDVVQRRASQTALVDEPGGSAAAFS
jgi:hypothetical protein